MQNKRDLLKVAQRKKQKRQVLKARMIFFGAIFLILLIALVFVSRIKGIRIDKIEVVGNSIIDKSEIIKVVENDINGNYLFVIPKRNSFIFPERKISRDLNEKFKRITDLKIERENRKILTITITERLNQYLWCGAVEEINNLQDNCYFIDSRGYIFDKSPYFSGNAYFRFYGVGDLKDTNLALGNYFLTIEEFSKLNNYKDSLTDMGIKSFAFLIKPDGDRELLLDYYYVGNEPAKIIFNEKEDLEKIKSNFELALKNEPLSTKFFKDISKLLYIDLRFENKVFYKFSDGKNLL